VGKAERFDEEVTASFDPNIFLAKVSDGKAISKYQKGQIVFSQGDRADAVFYIQKGKIKLTVVSERGKEAVVGLLGPPGLSSIGRSKLARTVVNLRLRPCHASLIGGDRRNSPSSLAKFTANRRASSRLSRFGRRAMRRSDMSGIGGEVEVRGLRLKRR